MTRADWFEDDYKQKPIAFDYGGTLRMTDGLPGMRDLVRRLNFAGVPCVIISAVADGYNPAPILEEIKQLKDSYGQPLQFDAVKFTYYPPNPTEQDAIHTGHKKAAVMRELGAELLFDDSRHVCAVVNAEQGLRAVLISEARL